MAQKENQRIALTKKLLQEGLLRLLEVKSLDKISVTELCQESGINRATFYNHYASPQELLNDIENRVAKNLVEHIGSPKTAEEANAVVEAICEYFKANAHNILILHRCNADKAITNALYELNENYQFYRLNKRYSYVASQSNLRLISVFFHTGSYNMLLDWISNDQPLTPKELAALIVKVASENFLD